MIVICILGSSYLWSRTLVNDLLASFGEPLEIRFIDINLEAAEICKQWGEAASKSYGRKDKYFAFKDRRKALEGANAVLITLSTGGLDAMEQDIVIPEKYRIYATVGDTAGAGGWSRSIRNIPVFVEFANDFDEICPNAFIANYTNPMSSLTATLVKGCRNPVSGFCHAYFEIKDVIQKIFELPDWSKISVEIAGMNHFTWVTDFKVDNQNGYVLLKQKIGSGSLRDVMPHGSSDEIGYFSAHNLCVELYDAFGYIPYPADRHTSEFVSYALTNLNERVEKSDSKGNKYEVFKYCDIVRTPISYRREYAVNAKKELLENINKIKEQTGQTPPKSRETGAEMIRAYLYNQTVMDAVNTLNIGQIKGLPEGACVETMGVVDGFGVRPVMVNNVPEHLLEIMRPQAICQKWITDGVINRDKNLLLQALYRDPQCAHLKPNEVKAMAEELFEANKEFIRL